MNLVFRYTVALLLFVAALDAGFASFDLNLSGLSSLSKMGKELNKLSDLNLSIFKRYKKEDNKTTVNPDLKREAKPLENSKSHNRKNNDKNGSNN